MRNKSKWYSILLIGLVVLLASSMVACGEEVPLSSPTIAFSPSSLSFSAQEGGANPASKTLSISNSGSGTLDWTVTADANCVSLSPTSGASTGESDSVTVSVDISGMDAADYTATITIAAPGASNSPRTIAVDLDIAPPTESKTYSRYGFSFEYPKEFSVTESGLLQSVADANSGVVQVYRENDENQMFQVGWIYIVQSTWEVGGDLQRQLDDFYEGIEAEEDVVSVARGEVVETTKSGHQIIYQYYAVTDTEDYKLYGITAASYCDDSEMLYFLTTMGDAISGEQEALEDFENYLDSFVCH